MYNASTLALVGMYLVGFVILVFTATFPLGFNIQYLPIVGGLCGIELILYDLFKSLKKEEMTLYDIYKKLKKEEQGKQKVLP